MQLNGHEDTERCSKYPDHCSSARHRLRSQIADLFGQEQILFSFFQCFRNSEELEDHTAMYWVVLSRLCFIVFPPFADILICSPFTWATDCVCAKHMSFHSVLRFALSLCRPCGLTEEGLTVAVTLKHRRTTSFKPVMPMKLTWNFLKVWLWWI